MDLKEMLLKEGIVKVKRPDEEPFMLKSGKKSRLFIDIKEASLNPAILREIVRLIADCYGFSNCTRIASVAVGGVPIATALSLQTGIPQIIVRSEKHDRGTQSQIIGKCKGEICVLIEDVATTGGSIINAVKALDDAGAICDRVIVIVDREEGAHELCNNHALKLYSVLSKSDFGITEEI